ncbi:hypothetical protein [cyanobacterium endosymbiont of Epithemia clementina EcSB]|uniref:hypothetical protein n=1 Tax=cyanobacterium endosymbiont of Epithemia clementina EcSB TaxID=3034674 RepID=UPI002481379B|nr:hypothetical protein [cyanobacterium endosymbiont of Epithemia clementina EcSB]WGT67892.1 hypothetical protein P3F56_02055 [cyanobacterium endosymbiont of Epithemia clementina EcSB]
MTITFNDANVKAALAAIESDGATLDEKIEMLIEMATGLQKRIKSSQQLEDAVFLYHRGLELCSPDYPLLQARCLSGMGTALRTIPAEGESRLLEAKTAYETALPLLEKYASSEEVAEVHMNIGVVLQGLVPFGKATMQDAIKAYQKAAKVFIGENYPQEFSILQNNIAIAYLSTPLALDGEEMRQAIAIQSFEAALKWVTLTDHPSEYAMLKNNLANALQSFPSTHPIENNLKALAAYDEALKVRTPQNTPIEWANTMSNKANVLFNLPDDVEHPEKGNQNNLMEAKTCYQKAQEVFSQYGQWEQVEIVKKALQDIEVRFGS